jgi:hypothetical protein
VRPLVELLMSHEWLICNAARTLGSTVHDLGAADRGKGRHSVRLRTSEQDFQGSQLL